MASSLSSKKRIRQNEKRRALNRWHLKSMRTSIREFLDKIAHGTVDEAKDALKKAASVIDRSAQNGVIHKNQASRRKSRLNARLKGKATSKAA